MKELEQYLGTTYSDSCQPFIMTETTANFPNPEMPTITDLGTDRQKQMERWPTLRKRILMRPPAKI